jgi:U3 small nucleolar RNA-associated protein 18
MIGDDIDVGLPEDPPDSSSSGDEGQSEDPSIHDGPPDGSEAPNTRPSAPHNLKSRKTPAWTDDDDSTLEVSLASSARLRKLRDAPEEDAVKGPEYERRLRRQFVKMNPTPEWATAARRKRRRKGSEVDDADADDVNADVLTQDLDALLTSSGGILGRKSRTRLDPGVLAIERLRDANQAAPAEGEITASKFHPSPQVSMLLVASSDRRIRLFNVRVFRSFARSQQKFPISPLALTLKKNSKNTGRRTHEPTPANPSHPHVARHQRTVPSLRHLRPSHRPPSVLLHI